MKRIKRMVALSMSIAIGVNMIFSGNISSAKEEKGLKFVVAPQFEGKTSELMELGKKLVKEHSEVGDQGDITVYYTGNTYTVEQQEYAVFMLVNKTTTNIDHDATFKISWSYDG